MHKVNAVSLARIVAVGDLHGDNGNALKVLQMAGVVDGQGSWTGDVDYFVQTGDIVDRYVSLQCEQVLLSKVRLEVMIPSSSSLGWKI